MNNHGIGSWIARRQRIAGHRPALVFGAQTWTYDELGERIDRLADALHTLGVRHGDRVGYLGPNHPAFLELLFAAGSLGAIPVPVNYRLAIDEVAAIIEDAGAGVLLYAPEVADTVAALKSRWSVHTCIRLEGPGRDEPGYEALLASASPVHLDVPVDHDDIGLMVYTSGTAGHPKGVMLTHGNLTWNAMNFLVAGDFRGDDVSLAIAPFFRVGGLAVTLLETLLVGGTVVLMSAFDAGRALELIEHHRITILFGGPDLLRALEEHPRITRTDVSSIRVCYTGGAPVPEPLIRSYLDRGIPILQGYGLSEAGPLALLLDPDDMLRKVGSAGRPVFLTDVRVVRSDLTDAPPGEVGEILVAGPNVMKGYWNRPDLTERTIIEGGWLRTGDAARRDDEGYVYIVGRIADAYTTGVQLVFPGDIERLLIDHPAVHDVAVVGVADDRVGQAGVAFVVPTFGASGTADAADAADAADSAEAGVTAAELLRWTIDRLDRPEVLRELRFTPEIPRNPAGKVLRHHLQEMATRPDAT